MAHYYFKVPPHIAEKMQIVNRPEKRLKDGNYIACYSNMAMFYPPYQAVAKAASMGCLALQPWQMLEEIKPDGRSLPLPEPTDPRFFPPQKTDKEDVVIGEEEISEDDNEQTIVAEIVVETDSETEVEEESANEGGNEETAEETNEEGGE